MRLTEKLLSFADNVARIERYWRPLHADLTFPQNRNRNSPEYRISLSFYGVDVNRSFHRLQVALFELLPLRRRQIEPERIRSEWFIESGAIRIVDAPVKSHDPNRTAGVAIVTSQAAVIFGPEN